MNALKLFGMFLAVMLVANLQTGEVEGQSIVQRRLHPGTYQQPSMRARQPVVRYYVSPQTAQAQQTGESYRSFSFEPGETNEESVQQGNEIPVYNPIRPRRSVPTHFRSIEHRRLHPGTN